MLVVTVGSTICAPSMVAKVVLVFFFFWVEIKQRLYFTVRRTNVRRHVRTYLDDCLEIYAYNYSN